MRWHANFGVGLAALLFLALPATAQVTVGEQTSLNLSGDLSFGYSGLFGDTDPSNHGLNFGGEGQLTGSYYNPNFLYFNVQPYYNRSQSNSSSQSISDSSGFRSEADFFRGSHFPGAITYDKTFDSSGQFGVPGIVGFTSHGGGQSFGISWSELLPNMPSLTASFLSSAEHSGVYGASGENQSTVRTLNLQSTYLIEGFHLNGMYLHQSQDATFPALLSGDSKIESNFGSDSITFQSSHKIPLNGQWIADVSHSGYTGDSNNGSNLGSTDGSNNRYDTGVSINPNHKLSLSFTTNYNTNVYAALQQQILQAGGSVSQHSQGASFSALSLNGFAFYTLTPHIAVTGTWGHQIQYLPEGTRSVTRYGGSVNFNYARSFLGAFNFSLGMVDLANEQGNQGASLVGNVNFSRKIRGWEVGSGFNYSQYVQTLVVTQTLSTYSYTAGVRRRFRDGIYWNGSFIGSRTGFVQVAGSGSHSEGANTSILFKRFNLNATYSKTQGVAILTPQGLAAIPTGVPTDFVGQQMQYGGTGFGFGGGATIRRWVLTANYTKSYGDTIGGTAPSFFDSRLLNARLQYRLRKVYLNAGFTRFQQSFGAAGSQPTNVNTYFVGFSRWFNVF